MRILLIIGIGGFIGSVLRYLTSIFIQNRFLSVFPYGTLGINIIGCFLIGIIFGLSERSNISVEWRLFLATGICGGFTTFSAFSIETFGMIRDGQILPAFTYIIASIVLGLLATFTGTSVQKFF